MALHSSIHIAYKFCSVACKLFRTLHLSAQINFNPHNFSATFAVFSETQAHNSFETSHPGWDKRKICYAPNCVASLTIFAGQHNHFGAFLSSLGLAAAHSSVCSQTSVAKYDEGWRWWFNPWMDYGELLIFALIMLGKPLSRDCRWIFSKRTNEADFRCVFIRPEGIFLKRTNSLAPNYVGLGNGRAEIFC